MRTIEEMVKCSKLCCNDESCSTENHQCSYGDESMIDCVDRLNGNYERIMQAVSKISNIDRLEEICNAECEGRCVIMPQSPQHASNGDSRPNCFYSDTASEFCLGMAHGDDDYPVRECEKCWYLDANEDLRAEQAKEREQK